MWRLYCGWVVPMKSSSLFEAERKSLSDLMKSERLMLFSFAVGAIVGTFAPLIVPQMDRHFKLTSLLYGFGCSVGFTISSKTRQRKEKIYAAIDQAQAASLKQDLAHEIAFDSQLARLSAERRLAYEVMRLPVWEHSRWVQIFGLQGIIPPPPPPPASPPVDSEPIAFTSSSEQSAIADMMDDLAPQVEYAWFDDKFIDASKGVFGAKGSGKSTVLSYEAIRFKQLHPEGELRIGDLHFDEEESSWLPGMPPSEQLEKYIANKPDKILAHFRRAYALLKDRVDRGDRKGHPFKLICDEFIATCARWSEKEREEVLQAIQLSQYEGRKYGVNITLGLHSLKKEQSGIDSSVLANMDLLFLGNALADPNLKLPSDFDAKLLVNRQQALQMTLKKQQGFACVVRKLGDAPQIQVIPFIDLSKYQYQASPESKDWYQEIKSWYFSQDPAPSDDEVAVKWHKLTGKTLNPSGLKVLMEHLTGINDTEI